MKNNYYTPNIKEFHEGFNYEIYKENKLVEINLEGETRCVSGWFKEVFSIDGRENYRIYNLLKENKIRVNATTSL